MYIKCCKCDGAGVYLDGVCSACQGSGVVYVETLEVQEDNNLAGK